MPKNVKRPGVEAGVNLIALHKNVRAWETVEGHGPEVVGSIRQLAEREEALKRLAASASSNQTNQDFAFSKDDLDAIVLWKHTVGKNRIYNVKYLNANGEDAVRKHSQKAVQLARQIQLDDLLEDESAGEDGDDETEGDGLGGGGLLSPAGRAAVQEPLAELGKLRGVGPATASAILSLVRPDVYCYLYDEVIDCFEPQRDYKMSNYLRVNGRCLRLARDLGGGDWTSARVAKTVWIAARFLALHGRDPTAGLLADAGDGDDEGDDDSEESAGDDQSSSDDKAKKAKRQRTSE